MGQMVAFRPPAARDKWLRDPAREDVRAVTRVLPELGRLRPAAVKKIRKFVELLLREA